MPLLSIVSNKHQHYVDFLRPFVQLQWKKKTNIRKMKKTGKKTYHFFENWMWFWVRIFNLLERELLGRELGERQRGVSSPKRRYFIVTAVTLSRWHTVTQRFLYMLLISFKTKVLIIYIYTNTRGLGLSAETLKHIRRICVTLSLQTPFIKFSAVRKLILYWPNPLSKILSYLKNIEEWRS